MNILVTGGAGYIGSHTVVELQSKGHDVVIVDNLANSNKKIMGRIKQITNKVPGFYHIDIRDKDSLSEICSKNKFDCCMHFAGLKSVNESIKYPLEYYNNNIIGTLTLLDVLKKFECKNIIFSSSATVYGTPEKVPITEDCPKNHCTNPYGQTKAMIEQILTDIYNANKEWNVVLLRYFNPVGAHKSGLIGENPKGVPNNLMPYITQVGIGKIDKLNVFGNDYNTPDGTGVRDYIHVVDLAKGHVSALKAIENRYGLSVYNLGTGTGYSVLDVVNTFEKVNDVKIPYVFKNRRCGDVGVCYSDPSKARKELNWTAKYSLEDMCRDSWKWQKNNPNGIN